jgi:alpha-L-fucosidase
MKKLILLITCMVYFTGTKGQTFSSKEERLEWWQDARFGMFIHWGPVSLKGTEISWSRGGSGIPIEEYDALYKQFNPVNYNADKWVKLAKDAGMKYIVFTSKHHDGFCMWDTKYTDHNIMNSPFKRDVMKELAEACKKQGIALGFYHSTCDWYNPDFPLTSPGGTVRRTTSNIERYTEYLKNQSFEIIKNYGPLLVMWYDVPQEFDSIRGQGVINYIRKIQPDILVNNRTGAKGDFDTPEQRVGTFQNNRAWETCMTIGRQWAWKPNDEVKSLEQCLHSLIRSSGGDGNLLFNVGPKPDGMIEPLQAERLREMGKWLEKYGYTIYNTRGGPFKPTDWGVSTRRGNKIYLHILKWAGDSPKIILPDLGMEIKKCTLTGGGIVKYTNLKGENIIEFDSKLLQPINTIIEIEVAGNAMDIKLMDVAPQSLSYMKRVNASSNPDPQWTDIKSINNGDWVGTYWQPANDDKTPWAEIDLGKTQKITKAVLYESGQKIKAFELQYKSGNDWKTFYKGTTIGPKAEISFKEINTQFIRLVISSFSTTPGIYEIILLNE